MSACSDVTAWSRVGARHQAHGEIVVRGARHGLRLAGCHAGLLEPVSECRRVDHGAVHGLAGSKLRKLPYPARTVGLVCRKSRLAQDGTSPSPTPKVSLAVTSEPKPWHQSPTWPSRLRSSKQRHSRPFGNRCLECLILERFNYLSKELVPVTRLGKGQIENSQSRADLQQGQNGIDTHALTGRSTALERLESPAKFSSRASTSSRWLSLSSLKNTTACGSFRSLSKRYPLESTTM